MSFGPALDSHCFAVSGFVQLSLVSFYVESSLIGSSVSIAVSEQVVRLVIWRALSIDPQRFLFFFAVNNATVTAQSRI